MLMAPGDPSLAAARSFRTMLEALSRPGSIHILPEVFSPPKSMSAGMATLCLALADLDVPLWLDPVADPDCADWLRFHCGCPLVQLPEEASLACVLDPARMPPLAAYRQGDSEYPDRSATVFVAVTDLAEGRGVKLAGPGINREREIEASGLPEGFWKQWKENAAGYPLGVDIFFVSGNRIAGLPRSITAEVR
ncbi:MAG: phosphonate C-P lyase system protein PhnH [Solidesulfovibrio sp.]